MANRNVKHPSSGPSTAKGKLHGNVSPVKTVSWPGLPGKTQSGDRSAGVRKVPGGAAQEGL